MLLYHLLLFMEEFIISSDIEFFSISCVLLLSISESGELFLIKPQVRHPPEPQPVIAVAVVIMAAIKPKIFFFILF
jgi:hypothetical protein